MHHCWTLSFCIGWSGFHATNSGSLSVNNGADISDQEWNSHFLMSVTAGGTDNFQLWCHCPRDGGCHHCTGHPTDLLVTVQDTEPIVTLVLNVGNNDWGGEVL